MMLGNHSRSCLSLLPVTLFAFVVACEKPWETSISRQNYTSLLENVRSHATEQQLRELDDALAPVKVASGLAKKSEGEILEGKTFRQVIDLAKTDAEKQRIEKEKAKIAEEKKSRAVRRLAAYVEQNCLEAVSWVKGSREDSNGFGKKVTVFPTLKNKMKVDIIAFEGTLTIFDLLDNKLIEAPIKGLDKISTGETVTKGWDYDVSFGSSQSKELYTEDGSHLKFQLALTKIMLSDNSTISINSGVPESFVTETVLIKKGVDAKRAREIEDTRYRLDALASALKMYKMFANTYPKTEVGLGVLISNKAKDKSWRGPYIEANKLKDSWGHDWLYESNGTTFTLSSNGPNGIPRDDDDIGFDATAVTETH